MINLLKRKSVGNFANKYIDGEERFKEIVYNCRSGSNLQQRSLFGIEYRISTSGVDSCIVFPSYVDSQKYEIHQKRPMQMYARDFSVWEGYLSQESFKPLRKDNNELFIDILNKEVVDMFEIEDLDGESIFLQFLFSFVPKSEIFRQEKALKEYEKYLNTGGMRIEEVQKKILDEILQFQITSLLPYRAKLSHEIIIKYINNALSSFNYYNGVKLRKSLWYDKELTYYNNRVINSMNYNNFISISELNSMFDLETEIKLSLEHNLESDFNDTNNYNDNQYSNQYSQSDLVSLLPKIGSSNDLADSYDSDKTVSQVAEALKRVRLINQARIHNSEVTTGVRLITIQFDIPKGINITQLQKRTKDIQAVLGVNSLGIEQGSEPDTVKFTIPNKESIIVTLGDLMDRSEYKEFINEENNSLPFVAGVDEVNSPIYLSLTKLVHLMVAGTTGSGKSAFINSLALSLILHHTPKELRMLMIDPKRVEFGNFKKFPHVDAVITDMEKAESLLKEIVGEMDERYSLLEENNAKNIKVFNKKVSKEEKMPYIVCIIDEYADLKDVFPNVEEHIARLGQKARAAGIHLIIATQRPDVKVISGRVKSVIPNAISFNLKNNGNYRTVFGTSIPYSSLMGKGDGVMKIEGHTKEFQRFQSAIVTPYEETEDELYESLASNYANFESVINSIQIQDEPPVVESEDIMMNELKQIIANTKETKIAPIRSKLGVKTETVTKMMNNLVEEGWLKKHNSKAKGYEIIATEEELNKYK